MEHNKIPKDAKELIEFLEKTFGVSFDINSNKLNQFSLKFNLENNRHKFINNQVIHPSYELISHNDKSEIIIDTPGITNSEQIDIKIENGVMNFIAKNDDFNYHQNISNLKFFKKEPIIIVKNRVTIIYI